MNARLALEDGSIFPGTAFGAADREVTGEVVFNTAMTGYQESLTDPSYAGQVLVMTATQIGNYGINDDDMESARPQVAGFVVRQLSRRVSNHRATGALGEWLQEHGIPAIEGVDTRALVRRLRVRGALRGVISTDAAISDADLLARARAAPSMAGQNLARDVSPATAAVVDPAGGAEIEKWWPEDGVEADGAEMIVVALDCGAKKNIYRHLSRRGCRIHAVPFDTSAEKIREIAPDGVFVSNGPGDPAAVDQAVATLREVAGEVPTFGICLGHQLLALALGATTYKLKFGHRGANQPVRDCRTGRVEITSQNHGFCIDADSLPQDCEVTHLHLNDGTIAGFRHRTRPIAAVQFHPEASPGPHDSMGLFDSFVRQMRERRAERASAS